MAYSTLAMASEGLSGAEIEQAVIAGLYEAFDANRPLTMNDLLDVLNVLAPTEFNIIFESAGPSAPGASALPEARPAPRRSCCSGW